MEKITFFKKGTFRSQQQSEETKLGSIVLKGSLSSSICLLRISVANDISLKTYNVKIILK